MAQNGQIGDVWEATVGGHGPTIKYRVMLLKSAHALANDFLPLPPGMVDMTVWDTVVVSSDPGGFNPNEKLDVPDVWLHGKPFGTMTWSLISRVDPP